MSKKVLDDEDFEASLNQPGMKEQLAFLNNPMDPELSKIKGRVAFFNIGKEGQENQQML